MGESEEAMEWRARGRLLVLVALALLLEGGLARSAPERGALTDGRGLAQPHPPVMMAAITPTSQPTAAVAPDVQRQVVTEVFTHDLAALLASYGARGVTATGLLIVDTRSGLVVQVEQDAVFPAASLYKLFVLWKVEAEIAAGRLADDTELVLQEEDVDVDDDGEPFASPGSVVTVAEARRLMITESNNTAAWLLARTVGWTAIDELLQAHGFVQSRVLEQQTTSAREITRFFTGVFEQTLDPDLGPAEYATMRDLLAAQEINALLPAGFPPGTPFAHKTGTLPEITNDAGVLLPPTGQPLYVTVLTQGDETASADLMRELAQLVWRDLVMPAAPAGTP